MKVLLLEEISASLAKQVISQLSTIKANEPIEVIIFSYGGDIMAGTAIIHALKQTGSHITTNVIGASASMASIISQVGDVRKIAPDAKFNIHNGEAPIMGRNTKEAHLEAAKMLSIMDGQMIEALAKSNLNKVELSTLMKEDVLLTAEQAMDFGFFDEYSEPIAAVANFNKQILNMSKFQSILNEIKAKATKLGLAKAALSEEEANRLAELEGIEEPSEDEQAEINELITKRDAEEEEAPAAPAAETGAEILTSEMVTKKEYAEHVAATNGMLSQIVALLKVMPSKEQMEGLVEEATTTKLDGVLRAIKSKTTIPTATQNFKQNTQKRTTALPSNFVANFKSKQK